MSRTPPLLDNEAARQLNTLVRTWLPRATTEEKVRLIFAATKATPQTIANARTVLQTLQAEGRILPTVLATLSTKLDTLERVYVTDRMAAPVPPNIDDLRTMDLADGRRMLSNMLTTLGFTTRAQKSNLADLVVNDDRAAFDALFRPTNAPAAKQYIWDAIRILNERVEAVPVPAPAVPVPAPAVPFPAPAVPVPAPAVPVPAPAVPIPAPAVPVPAPAVPVPAPAVPVPAPAVPIPTPAVPVPAPAVPVPAPAVPVPAPAVPAPPTQCAPTPEQYSAIVAAATAMGRLVQAMDAARAAASGAPKTGWAQRLNPFKGGARTKSRKHSGLRRRKTQRRK